jgi:hypothetical protein
MSKKYVDELDMSYIVSCALRLLNVICTIGGGSTGRRSNKINFRHMVNIRHALVPHNRKCKTSIVVAGWLTDWRTKIMVPGQQINIPRS